METWWHDTRWHWGTPISVNIRCFLCFTLAPSKCNDQNKPGFCTGIKPTPRPKNKPLEMRLQLRYGHHSDPPKLWVISCVLAPSKWHVRSHEPRRTMRKLERMTLEDVNTSLDRSMDADLCWAGIHFTSASWCASSKPSESHAHVSYTEVSVSS